ncbi:MAG: MarR family winged helix-turn-helix transcriptional regulator [Ktedonobacteraceae bacterium]
MHSEDFFGYWLFYTQRRWAYAFGEALHACCQEHHKLYSVTPPQWGVLSALLEEDGMTIGALSQKRGLDPPTMTGIVKRLEQVKLVERVHDCEDRRVVRVSLIEEGHDLMRFLPAAVVAFSQAALQGISGEKQQEMLLLLQQTIANLSAIGPGMGDRFGLLPDFMRVDYADQKSRAEDQCNA